MCAFNKNDKNFARKDTMSQSQDQNNAGENPSARLVAVENSRSAQQTSHMQHAKENQRCPFCVLYRKVNKPRDFHMYGRYCYSMKNAWPYPHHAFHEMVVPYRHVTLFHELNFNEFLDCLQMCENVIDQYGIPGGAIVLRSGAFEATGGTISHLHFQIQTPDLSGPAFITINKGNPSNPDRLQMLQNILELDGVFPEESKQNLELIPNHGFFFDAASSCEFEQNYQPLTYMGLDVLSDYRLENTISTAVGLFNILRRTSEKCEGFVVVMYFGDNAYRNNNESLEIVAHGGVTIKVFPDAHKRDIPTIAVLHRAHNPDQALHFAKFLAGVK
jgi:diadenosine tetraphosphate (Ap4A) HIT family hydrolase